MNLVNDKNLVFSFHRSKFDSLFQIADFVNAAIGGRVNFYQIKRPSMIYIFARVALVAGFNFRGDVW